MFLFLKLNQLAISWMLQFYDKEYLGVGVVNFIWQHRKGLNLAKEVLMLQQKRLYLKYFACLFAKSIVGDLLYNPKSKLDLKKPKYATDAKAGTTN